MSEEIAAACADLAHIERLQEQLNHWRTRAQAAEDALLTVLASGQAERDAAQAVIRIARAVAREGWGISALRQAIEAYDQAGREKPC